MKKPDLFFKKEIKVDGYLICIESNNLLRIVIFKDEFPKIVFSYERYGNNFCGADVKAEIKDDILIVSLFNSIVEAPIFRIPVGVINEVVGELQNELNLIHNGLDLYCQFKSIYQYYFCYSFTAKNIIDVPSYIFRGYEIFNSNKIDLFFGWMTLKNVERLSSSEEKNVSLEFIEKMKEEILRINKDFLYSLQKK